MGHEALPLARLAEEFSKLPSIGRKTAQRLAYHVVSAPNDNVQAFVNAILEAREKIRYCDVCCNFTDELVCSVCSSPKRDRSVICVVESPKDVNDLQLTSTSARGFDSHDNPVLFFGNDWSIRLAEEKNKGLKLSEIAPRNTEN